MARRNWFGFCCCPTSGCELPTCLAGNQTLAVELSGFDTLTGSCLETYNGLYSLPYVPGSSTTTEDIVDDVLAVIFASCVFSVSRPVPGCNDPFPTSVCALIQWHKAGWGLAAASGVNLAFAQVYIGASGAVPPFYSCGSDYMILGANGGTGSTPAPIPLCPTPADKGTAYGIGFPDCHAEVWLP